MKQILHAEMWDKMQYLFRNYYDRMMHCALYFDGVVDKEKFKQALKFQIDNDPVLHSRYHNNFIRPYWVVRDYSIDDVLKVKASRNFDYDVDKFLSQSIPVESNAQIRVGIFEKDGKSLICFLVNHMCNDGGDFKYFIINLCKNYTKLCLNDNTLSIKHGSRAYDEVYSGLSEADKKTAKGLYKNISAVKDKHRFPLTPAASDDRNRIIRHKIPADKFAALRAAGKARGYTVNDVLLACYVQSLYEVGGFDKSSTVTVPCMVDLRRHMKDGGAGTGLTNHTGFMNCTVNGITGDVNETLEKIAKAMEANKKDKFLGLYSLPLLHLAYTILPQFISEFAIKIGYVNPLMGMSNIGIINPGEYNLNGLKPYDGFYTGAIKKKPFMQLALTTMNGEVTFSIAICGNTRDDAVVKKFYNVYDKCVDKLIESEARGEKE